MSNSPYYFSSFIDFFFSATRQNQELAPPEILEVWFSGYLLRVCVYSCAHWYILSGIFSARSTRGLPALPAFHSNEGPHFSRDFASTRFLNLHNLRVVLKGT